MPASPDAGSSPAAFSDTPALTGRITSVDALRGFDMFWIIGADALVGALGKMAQGNPVIGAVAAQLEHVEWEGFRFYDLIFPLFIFIVGVSIVFSLSKRLEAGAGPAPVGQVLRRFAILYLLGVFAYGGMAKGFSDIRLLGVLQRIALCYLFASLAFLYLKPSARVVLCVSLLVGYWAVMTFVPVPGAGAGSFAEGQNLANYVDRQYLPLRKWDGDHDPEGLLSTFPAIATCLLGIFAGTLLRRRELAGLRKVQLLIGCGAAAVVLGFLWSWQFPIIKKIWTSSFVLVAGGFSAILLGLFYLVIDVWKKDRWAVPFLWIGTNAITVYMLVHIVDLEKIAARLAGGEIKGSLDSVRPGAGDLLIACTALALAVLFCRFLYQRKMFIKV